MSDTTTNERWDALEMLLWIVNHHDKASRRRRGESVAPPADIAAIRGITHLPLYPAKPGIYFLCQHNRVVYIGQSRNVPLRVYTHRGGDRYNKPKRFDQVFYISVQEHRLDETEAALIRAFRPRDNTTIPVIDADDVWRVLRRLAEADA